MADTIDLAFSIVDEKGDISTLTFHVPATSVVADVLIAAEALADLLDPIVQGGFLNAALRLPVDLSGSTVNALASAGSDVQEKAKFVFRTAVDKVVSFFNIPTILESIFNAGSKEVDLGHSDVGALVTAVETGIDTTGDGGSSTITFCDNRGDDLYDLIEAVENWGRARK